MYPIFMSYTVRWVRLISLNLGDDPFNETHCQLLLLPSKSFSDIIQYVLYSIESDCVGSNTIATVLHIKNTYHRPDNAQ
jgi:hypothetical protein